MGSEGDPLQDVLASLGAGWLRLSGRVMTVAECSRQVLGRGSRPGHGLEFANGGHLGYFHFVYFAFTLGMTFQISDAVITNRTLRRLATLHDIIGFPFNTVILALTVNIAAGLV